MLALDLQCLDRLYLHGYLGQLQVGGQVIQFLNHRGYPVPSPACLQQIGDAFRRKVASFAEANHIPVVPLKAADRNIEVMQPDLDAAASAGRSQVAAIGVAQEPQRVFIARKRDTDPGKCPQFSFDKKDRRVTVYYFYLRDAGFGPAFIKVCTYCPWPLKIWVNGHEWAKQQCPQGRARLHRVVQRLCLLRRSRLAPEDLRRAAARHHRGVLPALAFAAPVAARPGRPAGRVLVGAVDGPGRGVPHDRVHPAALCPGLLRCPRDRQSRPRWPDTVEIIFDRQVRNGRQRATEGAFKTKVITRGVDVTVNAFYKHSRIKQYLKDGRALRIETVINAPG